MDILQYQREPDKEDKASKLEAVPINNGGKDTRRMITEEVDHEETSQGPQGNIIYSLENQPFGGSSHNTNERNEPFEYKSEPEVKRILPELKSLKKSNDDEPSSKKNEFETNVEKNGNGSESFEETADFCHTKNALGESGYQNEKHTGENSSELGVIISDDQENFKEENRDEAESIGHHKDDEITSEFKPQTQLGEKEASEKDESITDRNKIHTGTDVLGGSEGSRF